MDLEYTVKQGDHASSIAQAAGLPSYKSLWDDGANADLKTLRKNPNVLFPGDRLTVRAAQPKDLDAQTEKRHRFRRKETKLLLRLRILTDGGKPAKDARCHLAVEAREEDLKADGAGMIETPIPPEAHKGQLVVNEHLASINAPLGIGDLDPIDKASGQIARLNNLGYLAGKPAEPEDDTAKLRLRSAIEEFQCDHGLAVDGVFGTNTRKTLEKEHGC